MNFKNLRGRITLTTVQHKGQNHHIRSRASNRKTTSNEMRTMVPSNYDRKHNISVSGHVKPKQKLKRRQGEKTKAEVLTASSDEQTQQRRPQRGTTEEGEEDDRIERK